MDADLRKAFKTGGQKGVLIADVALGSPADQAGIVRGDVILRFDGKAVDSTSKLRNLVALRGSKAKVGVDLLRDGKARTVQVKLGQAPGQGKTKIAAPDEAAPKRLGLALDDLSRANRQRFGVDRSVNAGAVVVQVEPGSPAARAGIRPGDVITEAAGKPIESGQAFIDAVRKKDKVLLLVQRGKMARYAMLRR